MKRRYISIVVAVLLAGLFLAFSNLGCQGAKDMASGAGGAYSEAPGGGAKPGGDVEGAAGGGDAGGGSAADEHGPATISLGRTQGLSPSDPVPAKYDMVQDPLQPQICPLGEWCMFYVSFVAPAGRVLELVEKPQGTSCYVTPDRGPCSTPVLYDKVRYKEGDTETFHFIVRDDEGFETSYDLVTCAGSCPIGLQPIQVPKIPGTIPTGFCLSQQYDIQDKNLRDEIYKNLGIDVSECRVPDNKVSQLTVFRCQDCSIKSIAGLERFVSLRELDLVDNEIRDLSPLKALKSLKILNISWNPVGDVGPLWGLTELEVLRMNAFPDQSMRSRTIDISKLKALKKLSSLEVERYNLINIGEFKNLPLLNELRMNVTTVDGLPLGDISFLKELHKLNWIYIGGNNIKDISIFIDMYNKGAFHGEYPKIDVYENPLSNMGNVIKTLEGYGIEVLIR